MHSFIMRALLVAGVLVSSWAALSDSLPPDASYRPLPSQPFSVVRATDEAQEPAVMRRQADLLRARYDLSDQPIPGVFMSGGRRLCKTACESSFRRASPGTRSRK